MRKTGSGAAKSKSYAVLIVTTILAMFLTKAALAEPFDAPLEGEITSIVCPFKQELEYDVGRVKCGLINVPENRDKPDSRMIQLLYAHIVASARLDSEDDDEFGEPRLFASKIAVKKIAEDIINDIMTMW